MNDALISKGLFVDGSWHPGKGDSLVSINPSTLETVWTGACASMAQVNAAVDAARQAFLVWKKTPLEDRIALVRRFSQELKASEETLAELIGWETGKPIWESKTEVAAMIGKIELSIAGYEQRTGFSQQTTAQGEAVLRHRPHGVVAVFGPFNFPGHLPNGHMVPALIAGNTIVFKPSEQSPGVAELTLDCWIKVGLPRGVINLIQGAVGTGRALAEHKGIDGLFFTGSSSTGHAIHQQFGGQPEKILALEMGGNNPLIIEADIDIKAGVHHVIMSSFVSAGQRCTCARRVFIPEGDWGDEFIQQLVEATKHLSVGDYNQQPQPFMGSVISSDAATHLMNSYKHLVSLGGNVLLDMKLLKPGTGLLSPGIIDVTNINEIPDEENFGPLIQLYRYSFFNDAIEQANNTKYGLSASLLSNNDDHYELFLDQIRAGIVNRNKPTTGASSAAPFGGVGASGNHRPSAFYAADYCAYPVASMESATVELPTNLAPGMKL